MQQELLNNQTPLGCQGCYKQEQTQGRSQRVDSLQDYNNQIFTKTEIDFVDYRSSNICNFKCRSCNPEFSHGIANERRTHDSLKSFYRIIDTKTVSVTEHNHEWIINNLGQIKRLMFTGGEPTVIPEIKNIISEVISKYSNQIQILITSNASFSDDFWYDITKKINNLHWTISIDAVGSAAEIIRHGTNWPVIEHNARWLAKHANSLDINTVVSNLNIFQLMPLLKFGRELQINSITPMGRHGDIGCRHQFAVSQRPYRLSADNLSPELRIRAIEYLTECTNLDLDSEQSNMLHGLLKQIKQSKFDPALWSQSQEFNQVLDLIRNENHCVLFEEDLQ
jgi:sulfatase maturation enzyme AslB (radical SAM superfamily)